MKRLLCIGRVTNGAVVIDCPTLEERQTARNAELLAMLADLEDLQAGRTQPTIAWTEADQEACDNEGVGQEICLSPWNW